MDRVDDAEALLREAGHEEMADELRDRHLPAGVVGDRWSYEVAESFQGGLLNEITAFETDVRRTLAGGVSHVTEREQQRRWRERARRGDS